MMLNTKAKRKETRFETSMLFPLRPTLGGREGVLGSGCEIDVWRRRTQPPSRISAPVSRRSALSRLRCDQRRRSGTRRWEDASEAGRDPQERQAAVPLFGHGCHATGRRACVHACMAPVACSQCNGLGGVSQSGPRRAESAAKADGHRSECTHCL
jgi:hypothetical protein